MRVSSVDISPLWPYITSQQQQQARWGGEGGQRRQWRQRQPKRRQQQQLRKVSHLSFLSLILGGACCCYDKMRLLFVERGERKSLALSLSEFVSVVSLAKITTTYYTTWNNAMPNAYTHARGDMSRRQASTQGVHRVEAAYAMCMSVCVCVGGGGIIGGNGQWHHVALLQRRKHWGR